MSPDDEKYYEDLFEMFASNGWKRIEEDLDKIISLKREAVFNLNHGDDFFREKGIMETFLYFRNLKDITDSNYRLAQEGDE